MSQKCQTTFTAGAAGPTSAALQQPRFWVGEGGETGVHEYEKGKGRGQSEEEMESC